MDLINTIESIRMAQSTKRQAMRFFVIGSASNLIIYILYILLTSAGMGPKLAMSILYFIGTIQTFIFNKRWTFSHHGHHTKSFWRYVIVYATGYIANLTILKIFVDKLHYPHAIVQGATIILLAIGMFGSQKLWVFAVQKTI